MKITIFTINAFCLKPFTGNPAAVCILEQDIADDVKQAIAAEMNLAETAFLTKRNEADTFEIGHEFGLRWFTPIAEVPLCGHATLAAGHALFNEIGGPVGQVVDTLDGNKNTVVCFTTAQSGVLSASLRQDRSIVIELPLADCRPQEEDGFRELVQMSVGGLPVKDVRFSGLRRMLFICLDEDVTRSQLESMQPRTIDMLSAPNPGDAVTGVIVTLKGSEHNGCQNENGVTYDFVSRYFDPWDGPGEDPVTGAAHTVLARYWSEQLRKKDFFVRQCSKRGGELWVTIKDGSRVELAGKTMTVLRGSVIVDE